MNYIIGQFILVIILFKKFIVNLGNVKLITDAFVSIKTYMHSKKTFTNTRFTFTLSLGKKMLP